MGYFKAISSLTFLTCLVASSPACLGEQNTVEIQVNRTETPDDDYVTWGPTACRIRLHPLFRASEDLQVVLTNDVTETPPGREHPFDGDVSFASSVGAGETANELRLKLALPSDGSWVPFVIAGRFPVGASTGRSSSRDKDTVIEVHHTNESGPIVGMHRLMVRVRKNLFHLTDHEKYRLLSAINDLRVRGLYEKFVEVHDWAARGDRRHIGRINHPDYSYPDAAHRDSNFLAWHRIDLLQFERELQKNYPDVVMHYWKLDEGDPAGVVFSPDFYGANEVDTANPPTLNRTPYIDFVRFARNNPLYGWRITYQGRFANSELLTRWPIDRRKRPWLLGQTTVLPGEKEILAESDFLTFTDAFEADTHNKSHHWIGPPMRDCTVAPADPFFWSFHSWFDRIWARWQRKYDRFAVDGSHNSYEPQGKFDPNSANHPIGHYLEDTMWPWNGEVGEGTHADPNIRYFESRPPRAPIGPFPESPIEGLWPRHPTKPRVKDAIDYLGIDSSVMPHGYCYDDTPFGVATAGETKIQSEQDIEQNKRNTAALSAFFDKGLPKEERLRAIGTLLSGPAVSDLPKLMKVMKDEKDPELKSRALRLLCSARPTRKEAMRYALDLLGTEEASSIFQMEVLRIIDSLTHFAPKDTIPFSEIQAALRRSARQEGANKVRGGALSVLANRGDTGAIEFARQALKEKNNAVLDRVESLQILSLNGGSREHGSLLQNQLDFANAPLSRTMILNSSISSAEKGDLEKLVDSNESNERLKVIALHSLSASEHFPMFALKLLSSTSVPSEIKREAVALLRCSVTEGRVELQPDFIERLQDSSEHLSPSLRTEIMSLANFVENAE